MYISSTIITILIILVCIILFVALKTDNKNKEHFQTDSLSINNLNRLNCYNYMNENDEWKTWVDKSSNKASNRLKVLGTLRTATHRIGSIDGDNIAAMSGCVIPPETGREIYNVDPEVCRLYDPEDPNYFMDLEKTPQGCKFNFDHTVYGNKDKFNEFLDIAHKHYDKDLLDRIRQLEEEKQKIQKDIDNVNEDIAEQERIKKENEDRLMAYNDYNHTCNIQQRQINALDYNATISRNRRDNALATKKVLDELENYIINKHNELINEYNQVKSSY